MSTKRILTLIGLGLGSLILMAGTGILAIQGVNALINSNGYSDLVNNLATKFNLDPDAVEEVFQDTEDQRRSERLQEAVDNGDITAEQKTLIENKVEEMEAKIEEINNQEMTASQRQEALQELREECNSWANDNDIPRMFMMMMGERGGRGGMMMGGGMKGMGF